MFFASENPKIQGKSTTAGYMYSRYTSHDFYSSTMTVLRYGLASAVLATLIHNVAGGGITSKLQVHVSAFRLRAKRALHFVICPHFRR
jgi:hypothetical protein